MAALAACIGDLVENAIMLTMLGDPATASRVLLMLPFTIIKLVGAYGALTYAVLSHLDS